MSLSMALATTHDAMPYLTAIAFDRWFAGVVNVHLPSTLATAASAALLAILFGVAIGDALLRTTQRTGPWRVLAIVLTGLSLAPLALPPVALGGVVAHVTGLGPSPALNTVASGLRYGALAFTWGACLAPLAGLVTWSVLSRRPLAADRAARLMAPRHRLRLVLWPALRGPLLGVFGAATLLAMHDAITPPHFGVTTLASDTAATYLTSLDPMAASQSLLVPWILTTLIAALCIAPHPSTQGMPRVQTPLRHAPILTAVAVLLSVILPILHCARNGNAASLTLRPELMRSLTEAGVALIAGGLSGAVIVATRRPYSHGTKGRGLLRILWFAPLTAPGFLIGTLALSVAVSLPRAFEAAVWWCGFLLRCLPFAGLALLLTSVTARHRSLAALSLSPRRRMGFLLRRESPRLALLAATVTAAAALREVGFATAFSLPASETVAFRGAQELHYGFTRDAASHFLAAFVLAVLWGILMTTLLTVEATRTERRSLP